MSLKSKLKKAGKKGLVKAVEFNPAANVLYTGGSALNRATGGKGALTIHGALKGTKPVQFSQTTQAFSGYRGAAPKAGDWRLPVLNRASSKGVGMLAATVVQDVVAPTADAASEGLLGVDLKVLMWTAAGLGTAAIVAPPVIRALR